MALAATAAATCASRSACILRQISILCNPRIAISSKHLDDTRNGTMTSAAAAIIILTIRSQRRGLATTLWSLAIVAAALQIHGSWIIASAASTAVSSTTTTTTTTSSSSSQASAPVYRNPKASVEERVEDLLRRMTLEEKVGQMTQIERSVANASTIHSYHIGSVLSGGGSVPKPEASAGDWIDMVDGFQRAALGTRLGIPLIYGIDAVHGHNTVYGATIFPHNVGIGCTRDPDLARRIGAATALEVRATGIPYVFAPCIAVCRHPSWGRCYESYSEDPKLVESMTEIITGLQGQSPRAGEPYVASQLNVAATAKHYVGDGGTLHGIDENNTISSYKSLVRIHMAPYFDAVAKGVSTVMISFSSWNGVKMHANHKLISRVLKKQLQFKGFVISDWMGIDRITTPWGINYTYSVLTGINAGIDMVMVPFNYTDFQAETIALVEKGFISRRRIDDAVRRILRVKFMMGLFEHPYGDRSLAGNVGSEEHRVLAREAVRKSLVLLKNGKSGGKPLLPLNKNARKILVAGTHANDVGNLCGGWTITWQGSPGNITKGTTILEGILGVVSESTEVEYKQAPTESAVKGRGYEYAVVAVGEKPYAEYMGDDPKLVIPDEGVGAIRAVCAHVRCAVVIVSGRPLVVEPYLGLVDALVAAWLPGSEGGSGIAQVLFGDFPFTGKLSRTWFRNVDQLPLNYGNRDYDPLFPYGFGLSS